MKPTGNRTTTAIVKATLATLGLGALLIACGGEPESGEQTAAYAVGATTGSFDVADPAGWSPMAASGSSIATARGTGHDASTPASLQMTYQVAAGGYAGLEHRFPTGANWSANSAINMWVKGQGAGQTFLMQIYDATAERWEARFTVNFTGWQQVTIPFGSLKAAAWQPAGATVNGVQEFSRVTGLALFPCSGAGAGTVSIDSLVAGAGTATATTATTTATTTAAATTTTTTTAGPGLVGATGPNGTIIPLYTYPTDASWNAVIAAKQAHPTVPVLAVVNPSNGPGASASATYVAAIAKLAAAGIKVIGYVHTSWANRPVAELQSEMAQWKAWYPGVTGIFFDEMANAAGHEAYYSSLSANAKTAGFDFTIGNPGADTSESYVGSVDVILIYENAHLPLMTDIGGWHGSHARSNFGVIPYDVPSLDAAFVAAARPTVGYIYLQSADMPHPWSSVPTFLSDLLGALQ